MLVSKYRPISKLAIIVVLGLTLVPMTHISIPTVPVAYGATRTITLDGRLTGWNGTTLMPNPTIPLVEGDSVSLALSSGDGATHQFYVDVNRNMIAEGSRCNDSLVGPDKCSAVFPPSRTYNFTVDFAPGTYVYYCWYHPGAMFGNFVVQGFTVTSNPATLSIAQGSSDMSTITLTSVGGFSGTATFATAVSPGGPSLSLNPPSVTLPPAGLATSILTVNASLSALPGAYNIRINATIGSIVQAASLVVNVLGKDFTISSSPASLTVPAGSAATSTITLQSSNNFSGDITLTANSSPSGLDQAFSVTPLRLDAGATAKSTLTVSSPSGTTAGNYTELVTATNGTLTHLSSLSISVVDYGITGSPGSITITQGSSGTSIVTLTSLNGFDGTISLTSSSSSRNLVSSVSPSTVTLVAKGSSTAMLTISTTNNGLYGSATAPGNYNVTVTAAGGQTLHSLTLHITVSSSSFSPSLPILVGGVVGLIAAVLVSALFFRRRRTGKQAD